MESEPGSPMAKRDDAPPAWEAELGRVLELALNEIYIFDAGSLKFLMVNRGARENLGYSEGELRELTPVAIEPEFGGGRFESHIAALRDGETDRLLFETLHRRKDGTTYDVEGTLQLIRFQGAPAFMAIVLDVTDRNQLLRSLQESEEISRSVLETAVSPILLIDESCQILQANAATERVFGYSADELLGQNINVLMPSPYREAHDGFVSNYLKTGERHVIGVGREISARRKDGSIFPIDLAVGEVVRPDGHRLFTGMIRDLTHRKALEDRLLHVSEEERRAVGREIHDDLCQRLFGIGCLVKVLETKTGDLPPDVGQGIAELSRLVAEANTRAREMAHGLMPVALVSDGLMGALEELADTTLRATGIRCDFNCDKPVLVEDNKANIQLFRIAQEAVKNAVHHGSPKRIEIDLSSDSSNVRLVVRDDGIGLSTDGPPTQGMGLLTMGHRARTLGGSCDVHSNHGAIVTCVVPMHPSPTTLAGDPGPGSD